MKPLQEFFELPPSTRNVSVSPKMKRALTYIHLYYGRDIDLKDVASFIGIHPAYLCRRFKKEFGIPFHAYILKIRIQIAAYLLCHSEKSIKEISYTIGFRRPEIFSKAFKRFLGRTPTTYRHENVSKSENPWDAVSYSQFLYFRQTPEQPNTLSASSIALDLNVKK